MDELKIYKTLVESNNDYVVGRINGVKLAICDYPNKNFDNYMTTNSAGFSILLCECTEEQYNTFANIVDKIYPGMCVFNHN